MRQRKQKVLLIGSTGYERSCDDVTVSCSSWPDVGRVQNLRDFDTVILNLLPLASEELRASVPWSSFFSRLDLTAAYDVLKVGGSFIVVGDPRFSVDLPGTKGTTRTVPFLHWTCVDFYWDSAPGNTIEFEKSQNEGPLRNLLLKFDKWKYSLDYCHADTSTILAELGMPTSVLSEVDTETVCANRYGHALVFTLRYRFGCDTILDSFCGDSLDPITSGPVVFLPEASMSEDETIQCILTDICDIETSLPEPRWVADHTAPGQDAIDEEIADIKRRIDLASLELETAEQRKRTCRDCLKLLYEREFGLEPAVYAMLRELGAEVEEPVEKNKEDGWIAVTVGNSTYEGVLEIKSTRSDTFGEDGRKQLLDWVDRGSSLRGKNYKGIFIGNSAVDRPPDTRPNPFPDSWVRAATRNGFCAFETKDLYTSHELKAQGKLDTNRLWNAIFTTNGVLDVRTVISQGELAEGMDNQEQ